MRSANSDECAPSGTIRYSDKLSHKVVVYLLTGKHLICVNVKLIVIKTLKVERNTGAVTAH